MRGSAFETVVGALVVVAAAAFGFYAFSVSGRNTGGSYEIGAVFGRVDGVTVGSEVRVAGVKVGAVSASDLDPATYEARLRLAIVRGIAVPEDSIAKIVSDGLIGGAHVSIEPGASDVMLEAGETITLTQGSVDLLGLAVQAFTAPKTGEAPAEQSVPGDVE